MPMAQALLTARYSPNTALYFWTLAIERAGHRAEEVLITAMQRTSDIPTAESFWSRYVENQPQLLLTYARVVRPQNGAEYYQLWWERRARVRQLASFEISN